MPERPSSSAHSSPAGSRPNSPDSYSSQERLILVPDDQFESDALLGLWPDEEEAPTPTTERSHSVSSAPSSNAPALPPRAIIPLLIGPSIKLGTTYIPRAVEIAGPIPALVGLVGMALLSAFTGQVWVLLGRYVSRWTIEEIVAEAVIRNPGRRGSGKDKWKRRIRKGTRGLVCVTALLLCAMYLHESAHLLQPAIPLETSYASQAGTTVILAAVLMPLVSATSLATRKVIWSNFLSIILQLVIAVVGTVHYFHGEDEERHTQTKRGLKLPKSHTEAGTWEAISILSFAFANQLLTLPLYSALVTNFAAKPTFAPRSRTRRMITSFPVLLLVSTAASIALTLPLILAPLTRHAAPPNPSDIPTVLRAPVRETLSRTLEAAIPTIQAFALILTIPPLFAGVIVPRVRHRTYRWMLFLLAALVAAVIPGRKASLTSLSMTLSLLTCYVLPAILHAVFHGLRRPRSILFSGSSAPLTSSEPATASGSGSVDPEALLRHKERSLQRRRLARRVLWDIGVWVVLGPVGMAATVWTAGRAIGVW